MAREFAPDGKIIIRGQGPQDLGRGIGQVPGDAERPQVPLLVCAIAWAKPLKVPVLPTSSPRSAARSAGGRRRRPLRITYAFPEFEKMAVVLYGRASLRPKAISSCQDPLTRPLKYGTWHRARARRRWKATGTFFDVCHRVGVLSPLSGGEA